MRIHAIQTGTVAITQNWRLGKGHGSIRRLNTLLDTHRRILQSAQSTPTVYLPAHDPASAQRLAERRVLPVAAVAAERLEIGEEARS
jgi:hypothetical protein